MHLEGGGVKLTLLPTIQHTSAFATVSWQAVAGPPPQCALCGALPVAGPLPPSYGHLTKMQLLYLNINKLSGPLPGAWSGMTVLEEVVLANNALAGPAPPSWGSWARVKVVVLFGNPQLRGCLPRAWRGKVNMNKRVEAYLISPYKGSNPLTAGTGITGFC